MRQIDIKDIHLDKDMGNTNLINQKDKQEFFKNVDDLDSQPSKKNSMIFSDLNEDKKVTQTLNIG